MYNRDSRIMRRLLGKTTSDPSTADLSASSSQASPSTPILYRPTRSQNAAYSSNVPIHSLDVSPDKRSVALAGPHILKTLRLDDSADGPKGPASFQWHEGLDLRAAITSQASSGSGSRANLVTEQLSIRDVKWLGNSNFFTACANGRIFAYDLARMGTGAASEAAEYIQIQEDSRQVNTLDVNPHRKSWLLSGSQDGVARVFDANSPSQNRSGFLTFRQRFQTLKCIDSVREVKWSPVVGTEMACCTEAGVVLKWDVRQPGKPLLRINAHEKACSSIAWHPDGVHLISAGWDSKLHVWDLSNQDKRQKPKWTISTPAPVSCVAWRPGLWSATAQSKRVAQVSVTYDENTKRRYGASVVHIWDLARPTMPYREIDQFDSSPTALHWLDQDLLWTVGHDGHFNQCDVAFSARVMERQTMSAMAFSPRGDTMVFLDERPQPHRPRLSSMSYPPETIVRSHAYGTSPSTPMLSVSKSDSEEDVGSFLGSKRRPRKRRSSVRGVQPISTTPPSGSSSLNDGKAILGLDQALKISGTFRSMQAMAFGHIPAAKTVDVYQYLTSVYLETLYEQLPHKEGGRPLVHRIGFILEEYAKAAEQMSYFRLAQTWRIIAFAMDLLLKRRGQYHLEMRISRFQKMKIEDKKFGEKHRPGDLFNGIHLRPQGDDTPRRPSGQLSVDGRLAPRSLLAEEIESTSNVATPLARPADVADGVDFHDHYHHGKKLSPVLDPESLSLGSAAHGAFKDDPRRRLDSQPVSVHSQESDKTQISSTEGYDFYDTEHLAQAIEIDKHAHRADHSSAGSPGAQPRPTFARYDTAETYGMFSISGGTKSSGGTGSESAQSYGSPEKTRDSRQNSQGSNDEYHSRIRGEELGESPTKQRRDRQHHDAAREDSADEIFMISQTTGELDESFPSQTSMESENVTESSHQDFSPKDRRASDRSSSPLKTLSLQYSSLPTIIDNDYLPWEDDVPYPYPLSPEAPKSIRSPLPPLDPHTIVQRALEFETRTSALNASAMVLLLKPLTPEKVIDDHQASAVLRQHHSRLMGMSLFTEASLLRKVCLSGWPAGLPEWGDSYSAIYSPAQQNIKAALYCTKCRKPRNTDEEQGKENPWVCRRCKDVMAPCAVCGHREPEVASSPPALDLTDAVKSPLQQGDDDDDDDAGASLTQWWFCPTCRHGGHASCLTMWHSSLSSSPSVSPASPSSVVSSSIDSTYSDGCCPLDGCGHACLPGRYRHESSTMRSDELGRAASASALAASSPSLSDISNPTFHDKHNGVVGAASERGGYSSRRSSAANSRRSSPHRGTALGGGATGLGGLGNGGHGSVKSDGNEVGQSKAVGVAREMVRSGAGSAGAGGILSSSPSGTGSGVRERRKSVKFATGSG